MTQADDEARVEQVLNSLNNDTGDRCVDFFRRADGSFGYREFRLDPEDQGRWSLTAAHDRAIFAAMLGGPAGTTLLNLSAEGCSPG